jgi:hypothetical protein
VSKGGYDPWLGIVVKGGRVSVSSSDGELLVWQWGLGGVIAGGFQHPTSLMVALVSV